MGFKLVRSKLPDWAATHGVSGTYRASPDPVAALKKKMLEEFGEYIESNNPSELYDLLDIVDELIRLTSNDAIARLHEEKVIRLGHYRDHIEWSPVPFEELTNEIP